MLRNIYFTSIFLMLSSTIAAQSAVSAANKFINILDAEKKTKTLFPFDTDERYNFHFFPKERKGISLSELDSKQREAAFELVRNSMSEQGAKKIKEVIELEGILRDVEGRSGNDEYRDPGK